MMAEGADEGRHQRDDAWSATASPILAYSRVRLGISRPTFPQHPSSHHVHSRRSLPETPAYTDILQYLTRDRTRQLQHSNKPSFPRVAQHAASVRANHHPIFHRSYLRSSGSRPIRQVHQERANVRARKRAESQVKSICGYHDRRSSQLALTDSKKLKAVAKMRTGNVFSALLIIPIAGMLQGVHFQPRLLRLNCMRTPVPLRGTITMAGPEQGWRTCTRP